MANNNGVGGTTSNRQPGGVFDNQSVADARGIIPQGTPGATGPRGPAGPRGLIGPMGDPGTNGTSITGITDDDTAMENGVAGNRLTINLSDGTSRSVFLPFGQDGDAGRSITGVTQNPPSPTAGQSSVLTITFSSGDPVMVTLPAGAQGAPGPRAAFGTPTVSDVAAGGNATATISGTGSTADPYILALGIPEGEQGEQAMFGTPVALPVPAGRPAAVNIQGNGSTANPYILNFSIPDGAAGAQGPQAMFGQPTIATGPESIVITGTGSTADPYILRLVLPIDTDTTYTFAGGTGGSYTVTPSDTATAQTVETLSTGEQAVVAANPFLDEERIKLAAARIQNIVAAAPASDGSITYTAEAVDAMGRADPGNNVTWTTGGGTNPAPTESFTARLTATNPRDRAAITTDATGNASAVAVSSGSGYSVTLTLGVSGQGFNYNGYQNLRFPSGVSTGAGPSGNRNVTTLVFNIPNNMVRNFEIDVDILSTQDQETGSPTPVAPHPIVRTFRVTAAPAPARNVFIGWAQEATQGQTTLSYNSLNVASPAGDTMILAQAGQMVPIPAPPSAAVNDLILIYPMDANIHFSLIGRIVPDQGNIIIDGLPEGRSGYIGIRINDRTSATTYTIAPGA